MTSSERTRAPQLLQDLVYAANSNEFENMKQMIEKELSMFVVNYLKNNWLGITEEWCPRLGEKVLNFMNTTNNRLEGINSKLKSVVSLNSPLEQFCDQLHIILKSLGKEKHNRLAYSLNKKVMHNYSPDASEFKYFRSVSDFAYKNIIK